MMEALKTDGLSRLDRLKGLLLGGAVGDALGAPIEFLRRDEILALFGPRGLTRYAPAYGRLGAITDDTQMTLFTLEGFIRASVRFSAKGICHPTSVIDHAYRRWLATQDLGLPREDLDGWLIQQRELWSRRAPGLTCTGALSVKPANQFGQPAINDSKGAGGIMRVGPLGLLAKDPYELACEVAALTHGHKTGIVAAGWFAAWIGGIGEGLPIRKAVRHAWQRCRGAAPELDAMLTKAFAAIAPEREHTVVPTQLGEGWIAEEAGAIAVWCCMSAPDPMEAMRLAVNIDGDSDTTGSLVGQVLGAAMGPGWIPQALLQDLELREVIETLAEDAIQMTEPIAEAFQARYPGW